MQISTQPLVVVVVVVFVASSLCSDCIAVNLFANFVCQFCCRRRFTCKLLFCFRIIATVTATVVVVVVVAINVIIIAVTNHTSALKFTFTALTKAALS